jgi:hypothetical protein
MYAYEGSPIALAEMLADAPPPCPLAGAATGSARFPAALPPGPRDPDPLTGEARLAASAAHRSATDDRLRPSEMLEAEVLAFLRGWTGVTGKRQPRAEVGVLMTTRAGGHP